MPRKYVYEDVKKFVSENSTCELVSTTYQSVTEKLIFRCACGTEFETDFHHFRGQNQRQCPACGFALRASKRRHTVESANARLAAIGCVIVSGDYKNNRSHVTVRCACGHNRVLTLNDALASKFSGLCKDCADRQFRGRNRFTTEQVRDRCADLGLELLSPEYISIKEPLEFRCSCGRTFVTTWEIVSYYNKTRCDYCSHKMSFGEQRIADWLDAHSFEYERQKCFTGCGGRRRQYRFDFYLPSQNTCIEFDGQQHFKVVDFAGTSEFEALERTLFDTQCRDLVKDLYCEDNGIRLIRVRYDEVENLSDILSSTLIPR